MFFGEFARGSGERYSKREACSKLRESSLSSLSYTRTCKKSEASHPARHRSVNESICERSPLARSAVGRTSYFMFLDRGIRHALNRAGQSRVQSLDSWTWVFVLEIVVLSKIASVEGEGIHDHCHQTLSSIKIY